ncbi:MAG: hypothetical protein AAB556_01640 [Patescibacteria group bacterium]
MPRSDNLAILLAFLWAFVMEGSQSLFPGFYTAFAVASILIYFFSPLVYRSLNSFLAGFLPFLGFCVFERRILYFMIPYFIILSLVIYVFAKK